MPGEETPHHHGSHECLLWSPVSSSSARQGIDAIIIPTARPPVYLAGAARLASNLDCTLVTLHSGKWTSAAEAARCIPAGVDLIAIDVPEPARLRLPDWETSRKLTGTVFKRRADTSAKRKLALITPGLCEEYLQDWASDQQQWHRHLSLLPTRQTRASALSSLSRKGSPRLTWQLGGQSADRELREFPSMRISA